MCGTQTAYDNVTGFGRMLSPNNIFGGKVKSFKAFTNGKKQRGGRPDSWIACRSWDTLWMSLVTAWGRLIATKSLQRNIF